MPYIQLHDAGEQLWLALEKEEREERERVLPLTRDGYSLPIDHDTMIYTERNGRARAPTG